MTRNKQTIEVVTISQERRRRWSADEKAALVRETYELGKGELAFYDGLSPEEAAKETLG